MAQFNNVMEIFKLLDKSNCRECNKKTCMAFAGDVFLGKALLSECPYVAPDVLEKYGNEKNTFRQEQEEKHRAMVDGLKQKISEIDLESRARELGAEYSNSRLRLKILGKPFSVDQNGGIVTDIHVNNWVVVPVYHYILYSRGKEPTGNWMSLRELPSGEDWYRFFEHRCEQSMKQIADLYPAFFEDIIRLFSGRQVDSHYDADLSLVLYPLPKLPLLICWQKPEDGLESDLKLFFDETAEDNLDIESIYSLVAGMTLMFEKLSRTHGFEENPLPL